MAATVVSNGLAAAQPPARMLGRAYAMFGSRAFVHQYEAHGVEAASFEEAFARVEDIGASYAALLGSAQYY